MKVAVIGTGYVGLVTGTLLAEIGHDVTCIDIDEMKIELLKTGIPTIYEPGLEQLLKNNLEKQKLSFTTNHATAFQNVELVFMAVGTPQGENGQANLSYIEQAAKDIAQTIDHDVTVVIKSTVPPGTNDYVEQQILKNLIHPVKIHVVSNPEFLREGHAIEDAFHGDRIVIGSEQREAGDLVESLFAPLQIPIVRTDRRSAEMIKYAANAFLAVKISYMNEIANLCDAIGADVTAVADGMGMDKRIGRAFLNAGIGYGGSCFPKDTEAVVHLAKQQAMQLSIVESAIKTNKAQRHRFVEKVLRHFDGNLTNKKIAILGLAFKPNTDDMREAPSVTIIDELQKNGAIIHVFDPIVTNEYSAASLYDCVTKADAVLLVTEWQDFLHADWTEIGKLVKGKVIFDGRNALEADKLQQLGWTYIGVGRERKRVYGFQES
ncbi:UDP-glucose dehydrogenase family protein [Sporosarcina sp. FSL K6-3457]|uniref:UDP-glucose dehydrogenase family protein n=1 Tax=Sporosarcina sp. FSL K6-3457 TaxID=2978204 RepID=UPI0030FAB81D